MFASTSVSLHILCSLLGIVFLPLLPNYPYLIAFLLQLNHNFFRELQFFLICQSRSGNHIPYGTSTFPSQCLSQFIEIQLSDQINSCLIHWTKNSMKVTMESLLFKDLSLVPVTVPSVHSRCFLKSGMFSNSR